MKYSDKFKKVMASNFIWYILDLNKFNEKETKEIFNRTLQIQKDKRKGCFF